MPVSRCLPAVLCALCLVLPACDEGKKGDDGDEASGEKDAEAAAKNVAEKIEADAKEAAQDIEDAKAGKDDDEEEDKGSATLKIGEADWTAERATARLRDGRLRISASQTDMKDGKVSRQELQLSIKDYGGPGSYTVMTPSMFVGVGLDVDKAKKAEGDDAKAQKVATDALMGAESMLLMNAKVEITEATDEHIDGTVKYEPASYSKDPPLEGKFHAIIDKD